MCTVSLQLLRVNDQAVSNLREVVSAVESCKKDYLQFDLDYNQVHPSPRLPPAHPLDSLLPCQPAHLPTHASANAPDS